MSRILIIEDELPMRTALVDCLESEGYRVLAASNGERGLDLAVREKPDLIVLDLMMPKIDGYTLCAEVRRIGRDTPVLMLTARGQIEDRVRGLDSGADDYLVKPFAMDELLARVRALLRRSQRPSRMVTQLELGEVQVDFTKKLAWRKRQPIHLTGKEFAMLQLLAESRGEPVSRERFLDIVWGYTAFPTTRTVDNHVAGLRTKLERDPEAPAWIKTVHGIGYRLETPENK